MSHPIETGRLEDRFAAFMRLHRRTMRRYFQSIGMFNGHPHLLFLLRRCPGITPKELAEHMELAPATVAVSVRRLEAAGLVHRQGDDKDGRVTHLFLTPAGVEMDEACRRGRDFLIESLYKGLSPAEQDTLYDLLGKMSDNLQAAYDSLPEIRKDEQSETLV